VGDRSHDPPAIQEAITGTNFETMKNTYDQVTVADMKEALGGIGKTRDASPPSLPCSAS
jgi:hypothetical protein